MELPMRYLTSLSIGTAVVALAACNASNRPVTTKSADGTTASPSGEVAADRDVSMVRVVNAEEKTPVTVLADNAPLFESVAPKQVTPYKEIKENMVTFKVVEGANPPPAATSADSGKNREVLVDGQRYTGVVLPAKNEAGVELRMLKDELTPDDGKARIRVINAAEGVGEIDIKISNGTDASGLSNRDRETRAGQKADSVTGRVSEGAQNAARDATNDDLFDNLNYGNEGGFRDIDPQTGSLEIRKDGQNRPLLSLPNLRFEAGTAYTFVVVTNGQKVDVIRFEDKVGPKPQDVGVNR
jgi:hypothetical protein